MPTQDWMRAALKEKGHKLKDVAAALNVPPPRITDILTGKRGVQSDEVERLADMIGISPRSLLRSLEDGKLTIVPGDEGAPRVPVVGQLTGDGTLTPLPEDFPFTTVAPPPDAETSEGLSCYIMGDTSMGSLVAQGSLVITADPKVHYAPIVPGALFVLKLSDGRQVLRQYVKTAGGQDMLRAASDADEPSESFPFSILPDALSPKAHKGLGVGDIVGGVMWVHTRLIKPH
ncbi:helix-turn-helix transcriptional regulator [Kordiimonas aestuarii]|uniref:helix-turn-helix transcriptional regulator n=1 Tax=Kordiimonas aestuarii TaxID=1005925 RepID=UPI0021D11A2C|nr:helix-turn-helix transcriptional regulator [Kordiimonas aestuarii]